MESDEGYFGERVAATYDEDSASMFDPAVVGPAVDRLAELAGDGRVLELAIGTSRIALPLAERGVRVVGIEPRRTARSLASRTPRLICAAVGDS